MGLFDSFLKDVVKEIAPDVDVDKLAKSAGDFLNTLAEEGEKLAESLPEEFKAEATFEYGDDISWEEMPEEENQYNYDGTYLEYFKNIFDTEFAEYSYEVETTDSDRPTTRFTFFKDGEKALFLELMPESSEAKKMRQICAAEGTPYLRFYYNHDGWWNTRSYVVNRMKGALKI